MARILGLAILLTLTSMTGAAAGDSVPRDPESCPRVSRVTPPTYIRVFRLHRRGSSIPARVETWRFKKYVAAVMASGAWPARPRASGMVGAQAIKQYAWWQIIHTCRHWKGRSFAITDSEQYLERGQRPWHRQTDRRMERVRAIWDIRLIKNDRLFRTGWRAGEGRDGWHLYEDTVTRLARRGWSFRRIIHSQLDPVSIRG